jgi:hypothetical protein
MRRSRSDRWARRAGFVLGLAGTAAVLLAARVPAQPHGLGLDLTVVPAPTSKLTLRPGGPILTAIGLRAGGGSAGRVTLINPASRTQLVRVRALPSSHDLDRALMVEVRLDGRRLYSGRLGGLRGGTRPGAIQSGDGLPLRVRVWLPPSATGWRGHIEDLTLSFDSAPVAPR